MGLPEEILLARKTSDIFLNPEPWEWPAVLVRWDQKWFAGSSLWMLFQQE